MAADNPWGAGAGLPDLGAPTQLCMQPGDVVLAHPHLAHRGGPNYSPHVRYMVYFRLKHREHGTDRMAAMLRTDLYADLPGASRDQDEEDKADDDAEASSKGSTGGAAAAGGGGGNGRGKGALGSAKGATDAAGTPHQQPTPAVNAIPYRAAKLNFTPRQLTEEQLQTFLEDGVVVVPGILPPEKLKEVHAGLDETLQQHGVDPNALEATATNLRALSSTNGAGGVLDLFYPPWKLEATLQNEAYFNAVTDIYQASYGSFTQVEEEQGQHHGGLPCAGSCADEAQQQRLWVHPYGAFDASTALAHIDRIGYRLQEEHNNAQPTNQQQQQQQQQQQMKPKRGPKARTLQRSLTPHMDCCPSALHAGGGKKRPRWRPIQCMLSLTDTLEPQAGGFECVKGFHREFDAYYAAGSPAASRAATEAAAANEANHGGENVVCVGDFCPIRTKEDSEVIARFRHVSIPAGAAVFWDQRIPHANSRGNTAGTPRAVIYGGFLPNVALNRAYAAQQLVQLKARSPQPDFWLRKDGAQSAEEAVDKSRGLPAVLCTQQNGQGGGGGEGGGGGSCSSGGGGGGGDTELLDPLPRCLLGL